MNSRHSKTRCFGAFSVLIALAMVACIGGSAAERTVQPTLAAPTPAADNTPVLANRTLVPRAVRLVIGFRPTATT